MILRTLKLRPGLLTRNARGGAMLTAMVVTGAVMLAASAAYQKFGDTRDAFRDSRVKNLVAAVETQVRRRALQPEAYSGCSAASGSENCRLNEGFFADIRQQNIPGATCLPGVRQCGVVISQMAFQPASRLLRAEILYAGTEVRVKPVSVEVNVPLEILQADIFHCGTIDKSKPVFAGFDSQGKPICQGFNECGPGQFVHEVNVSGRSLACKPLPGRVTCGAQQMISTFDWQGNALHTACSGLPDPPYAPTIQVTNTTASTVTNTFTNTSHTTNTNTNTTTTTGPTCTTEAVSLGGGQGSSPRVFGYAACDTSCQGGGYGPTSYCGGGCYSGYRGWMYCGDCRRNDVVCR